VAITSSLDWRFNKMRTFIIILILALSTLSFAQMVGNAKMVGQAVSSPGSASSNPFAAFCANEPTVTTCQPFDTAPAQVTVNDTLNGVVPVGGQSGGTYFCGLDTTVKANGAGSLLCDIPASASADLGGYKFAANADCGEGDDCWLQYRYRVDTAWRNNVPLNSGGPKVNQFELADGVNAPTNNCTNPEITTNAYDGSTPAPKIYQGCGVNDNDYKPMFPSLSSGSNFELEPGYLSCFYLDTSACNFWTANNWMTYTLHYKQGQKYTNMSGNYGHNTIFELYVAADGQPTQRTISMTDFDSVLFVDASDFVNGVIPPGYVATRDKVWFFPYTTGRCRSEAVITSASRSANVTTLTSTFPYWHSQGGACVLAGASIVVTGMSDPSFNGTWIATGQLSDFAITVTNSGSNATLPSENGSAIDSNIAQSASKLWYDSAVFTKCTVAHPNCRPPDPGTLTPNAPSDLVVTSNNGTDVGLQWKDNTVVYGSPAQTSWLVKRCTGELYASCYSPGATWTDITSSVQASISCASGSCTATNTGAGGTQYSYEVAAVNVAGNSGYSNSAMNTPGAAYDVICSVASSTSIACTWSQAPPAIATTGYDVAYCADVAGTCGNNSATTGYTNATTSATCCSYTVTGLSPSTTYTIRVKPHNAAGTYTDWGEHLYGGTSYGWGGQGASPTSQVTTPSAIGGVPAGIGWHDLGTSVQTSVCEPINFCSSGNAIAYTGMFADPTVSGIVFGIPGGHNDSADPNNYRYRCDSSPCAWERLTNYSGLTEYDCSNPNTTVISSNPPTGAPSTCSDTAPGTGTFPAARHGFGNQIYSTAAGKYYAFLGSFLAGGNAPPDRAVWKKTPTATSWTLVTDTSPMGQPYSYGFSNVALTAERASDHLLFIYDGINLWQYDTSTDTPTQLNSTPYGINTFYTTTAIDETHNYLVVMNALGPTLGYIKLDGSDPTYAINDVTSTADPTCHTAMAISMTNLTWDPIANDFISWPGTSANANTVYSLNPATWTCSTAAMTGYDTVTSFGNNTGVSRYVVYAPTIDAFIACPLANAKCFGLRRR
jgi:hypothetical protein